MTLESRSGEERFEIKRREVFRRAADDLKAQSQHSFSDEKHHGTIVNVVLKTRWSRACELYREAMDAPSEGEKAVVERGGSLPASSSARAGGETLAIRLRELWPKLHTLFLKGEGSTGTIGKDEFVDPQLETSEKVAEELVRLVPESYNYR
jgi:hypothetical protein